jgi:CxxC-x17-CxxC domain-containing protein
MGNFNRGEDRGGFRSGGRNGERESGRSGGFQKRSFGGASDRGNKEQMMHQATCSECGKRCDVPFRPVNGKPVYCNDCFGSKRGSLPVSSDRSPAKFHYENRERTGGNDDGVKRQLSEMNMKLDRLVKAMESLTGTNVKVSSVEAPKKEEKKEEKKSVDVVALKKVLDKATEKESPKEKVPTKEEKKSAPKKVVAKKATPAKKKK